MIMLQFMFSLRGCLYVVCLHLLCYCLWVNNSGDIHVLIVTMTLGWHCSIQWWSDLLINLICCFHEHCNERYVFGCSTLGADIHPLKASKFSVLSFWVCPRTILVYLPPLYPWRSSREKKYQTLPACTTSLLVFRSVGAWEEAMDMWLHTPKFQFLEKIGTKLEAKWNKSN